jgi:hypothetical protein
MWPADHRPMMVYASIARKSDGRGLVCMCGSQLRGKAIRDGREIARRGGQLGKTVSVEDRTVPDPDREIRRTRVDHGSLDAENASGRQPVRGPVSLWLDGDHETRRPWFARHEGCILLNIKWLREGLGWSGYNEHPSLRLASVPKWMCALDDRGLGWRRTRRSRLSHKSLPRQGYEIPTVRSRPEDLLGMGSPLA